MCYQDFVLFAVFLMKILLGGGDSRTACVSCENEYSLRREQDSVSVKKNICCKESRIASHSCEDDYLLYIEQNCLFRCENEYLLRREQDSVCCEDEYLFLREQDCKS